MTTTVIVYPSPGDGLKVEVTIGRLAPDALATVEYLHKGDQQKSYYAHDDMAVMVKEVPDTTPEAVGSADGTTHELAGAPRPGEDDDGA